MPTALITGCSSGIGRTLARGLTTAGIDVVATARSMTALDGLDVYRRLELDVTNAASVESVSNTCGDVDILINNAGISVWGPVETTDLEFAARCFDTNVLGAARMIQALVPRMRQRRSGAVVNISSVVTLRPGRAIVGWYTASKHALEALSEALRAELRDHGVRVVVILPGLIESDMSANRVTSGVDDQPYRDMADETLADASRRRGVQYPAEVVVRCVLAAIAHPDPPLRWAASPDVEAIAAQFSGTGSEVTIPRHLWKG